MSKTIEFRCSIAQTQSSLKFGGEIGRVTFEVPKQEVERAVALIALQGQPLRVTVEIDDGNTNPTTGEEKSGGEKASGRAWP